jgi:PPK2 family polyphosphate:nucleotide phosphotransferase
MIPSAFPNRFRVQPGSTISLETFDTAWEGSPEFKKWSDGLNQSLALQTLEKAQSILAEAQEKLYADDRWAVLVVLHGQAGADLDGVIRHVFSGINPQGCSVATFRRASAEELDHDYLWRYQKALPERGRIVLFKGSYYNQVVQVRVFPDQLAKQRLPVANGPEIWQRRCAEINAFEQQLANNGTLILKFFLDISREEQRRRLLKLLDDPAERWKYNPTDLAERGAWDAIQQAWDEAISQTSTTWAPWYILPGDHAWVAPTLASGILTQAVLDLGVDYPKVSEATQAAFAEARKKLEAE